MQKDVWIKVKGISLSGGEEDITELKTSGNYYRKNDKIYILYEEIPEDAGHAAKNTLKLYGDCVELIRKGGNSVNIVFSPKESWESQYVTPYGCLKMTFVTESISIEERADEIAVMIKYQILSGEDVLSENVLEITVSENK